MQDSNKYRLQHFPKVPPIVYEDVLSYISVLLAMGVNQQPAVNDYWASSKTSSGLYGCEYIKGQMTRV